MSLTLVRNRVVGPSLTSLGDVTFLMKMTMT
jgi:hypothetical protein